MNSEFEAKLDVETAKKYLVAFGYSEEQANQMLSSYASKFYIQQIEEYENVVRRFYGEQGIEALRTIIDGRNGGGRH